jgi:hypothetical protein
MGAAPVVVLSVALAVSALVGLSLSRSNTQLIDGLPVGTSLQPWRPFGVGTVVVPGRVKTTGVTVLTLARGAKPITIRRVALEGNQIRLGAVGLLGPDRRVYQFTSAAGFPSHFGRGSVPAEGAVVEDAVRGYQLLLGVEGSGKGFLVSHWLDVSYESGGKAYVQRVPQTLVLCPSAALLEGGTCGRPLLR